MVIHTTIHSIMIHSITITDTMDIIPDTITEVIIMEASILLFILRTTTLILIQEPTIAGIQGIIQITGEGKGKAFILHAGTAICLLLLLQDVKITCRVVWPPILHEDRQIQKQHLLLTIREELFQQPQEAGSCQMLLIPKVQIHQRAGALQQEQQLLQNLNTELLTEPIPRVIIIPV